MSGTYPKFFVQSVMSVLVTLAASSFANAIEAEREIWYNAAGEPVLAIDKKTGKRISLEVLKKEALIAKASMEARQEVQVAEPEIVEAPAKNIQPIKPIVSPTIPLVLQHKGAEVETGFQWSPRDTYYGSSYGYYGGYRVVPRFSRNGYYGPAQYVPACYPAYGHRHDRSYINGGYRRGGFILKYSRPNFSIRAKF